MNSQLRFTEKRKFREELVKKMRNDFIERNKDNINFVLAEKLELKRKEGVVLVVVCYRHGFIYNQNNRKPSFNIIDRYVWSISDPDFYV